MSEEEKTSEGRLSIEEFLRIMDSGEEIMAGSPVFETMSALSQEAIRITTEINSQYHTPEQIVELMRALTGREVPGNFRLFPPIYCDCGKNLVIGDNVFINAACEFQDQGGITIGAGTLIGPQVVIATLNHDMDPDRRQNLHPAPVHIGENVWIGAHVVIVPGVTIGDGAVVGAGAVVTKDVPARSVAVGVHARAIRRI